jgi:hypothetical protein
MAERLHMEAAPAGSRACPWKAENRCSLPMNREVGHGSHPTQCAYQHTNHTLWESRGRSSHPSNSMCLSTVIRDACKCTWRSRVPTHTQAHGDHPQPCIKRPCTVISLLNSSLEGLCQSHNQWCMQSHCDWSTYKWSTSKYLSGSSSIILLL